MNKYKKQLIFTIIIGIALLLIGLVFIIYGIREKSKLLYFGIIWCVLYAGLYIYKIIDVIRKLKNTSDSTDGATRLTDKGLILLYKMTKVFGDEGYVYFVKSGLKFSAKGNFACVKDFNNIPGYHLAFSIKGTNLVSKPDGYDDVIGYDECLFNIELAYFDGIKLSDPENDNGIILNNIEQLQGKTIKINPNDGYIAQIITVEWDEIDCGEITFDEWSDSAHIISFKFLASTGVNDVIAGTVNLIEDTEL